MDKSRFSIVETFELTVKERHIASLLKRIEELERENERLRRALHHAREVVCDSHGCKDAVGRIQKQALEVRDDV